MKIKVSAVAAIMVLSMACSKNDKQEEVYNATSVLQYIEKQPHLSLLNTAIMHAKVDTFFADGGPNTFFAPTDVAMQQAGFTKDVIQAYDPVALSRIITYQIVPGKLSTKEIVGFSNAYPTSLNPGFKPNVSRNYYGMFFNGVRIEKGNVQLADGIVHELTSFSLPPVDSMMQVIVQQPDLTYLAAAIDRCKALQGRIKLDTLTLFAPTDQAFRDFGFATISDIRQADTFELMKLLNTYVLHPDLGRLFFSDFIGSRSLNTDFLTINLPSPRNVVARVSFRTSLDGKSILPLRSDRQTGIVIPPNIIRPNILTKRGIIHVIDQVFVP